MNSTSNSASTDGLSNIESVLKPLADAAGFEIVQLEWAGSTKRRVLRCYLDTLASNSESAETPCTVSLDDCAEMSRMFGHALDAAEASGKHPLLSAMFAGAYNLEVSSPGLERPLRTAAHFRRFVGKRVVVKTAVEIIPGSAQRTFHGILRAVEQSSTDAGLVARETLMMDEADTGSPLQIPLSDIRRAHLVYEG